MDSGGIFLHWFHILTSFGLKRLSKHDFLRFFVCNDPYSILNFKRNLSIKSLDDLRFL